MALNKEINKIKENAYIFNQTDILLENGKLPSTEILKYVIENNLYEDFFNEEELNYTAVMLKDNAQIPDGTNFIQLRQYFHDMPYDTFISARAMSFLKQRKIYRHCPSCGSSLDDDNKFTAKYCPECKIQFFPRIEPCVIVLVCKGSEILLVKNKSFKRDFYGCVSGFIEQGETPEECAAREVKEETNIMVKNIKYVASQSWPFPDQLMIAFTAEYDSGEIKIQEDELVDAQWFSMENLPSLPNEGSVAYNLIHKWRN